MRARATLLAVALAVGGAAAVDELVAIAPAAPRAAIRVSPAGGVLACPIAVTGRGGAYLHLANLAPKASRVRVTLVPRRGRPAVVNVRLGPGSVDTIRLHRRVKGPASAIVDYEGGEVVASHTIWPARTDRRGGGAAASCAVPGGSDAVIPHARTFLARSTLVLLNPSGAEATVSVKLLADGRVLRPQSLHSRTVHARGRLAFRLGDHAFDARDLTAVVHADPGRVAAEVLVANAGGVSLLSGQAPSAHEVALAGASGGGTSVSVVGIGADESALEARLLGVAQQGKAPKIPVALPPSRAVRVGAPSRAQGAPIAYALDVGIGSPVASATSWHVRGGGDGAATEGAAPAQRWGGVVASITDSVSIRVLVANPGAETATVALRRIDNVRGSEETRTVAGGRVLSPRIARGRGTVAVEVRSDRPVVVALSMAAAGRHVSAFGLTAAPLVPPRPVSPVLDPRAGVPAVLRRP